MAALCLLATVGATPTDTCPQFWVGTLPVKINFLALRRTRERGVILLFFRLALALRSFCFLIVRLRVMLAAVPRCICGRVEAPARGVVCEGHHSRHEQGFWRGHVLARGRCASADVDGGVPEVSTG